MGHGPRYTLESGAGMGERDVYGEEEPPGIMRDYSTGCRFLA